MSGIPLYEALPARPGVFFSTLGWQEPTHIARRVPEDELREAVVHMAVQWSLGHAKPRQLTAAVNAYLDIGHSNAPPALTRPEGELPSATTRADYISKAAVLIERAEAAEREARECGKAKIGLIRERDALRAQDELREAVVAAARIYIGPMRSQPTGAKGHHELLAALDRLGALTKGDA